MNPSSREKPCSPMHEAKLLSRLWLSETAFEVELTRPPSFEFNPGQRIRFIHQNRERDYSLISSPDDPTLALCVRKMEGGFFSPALGSARIGSRFPFTGPHGYFVFRSSDRPALFVATGTGVAPFVSMARSGVRDFTLLHGVRARSELFYKTLFQDIARPYIPCISRTGDGIQRDQEMFQGRVTDYLLGHLSPSPYDFHLCGRAEMIRDVTLVIDQRFPGSRVYTETFY